MTQLDAHLHLLHPYARNLVEILRVVGLRGQDALHLPGDCLEWNAAGDPRLRCYDHKMKPDGRPLPVANEVARAVERHIYALSRDMQRPLTQAPHCSRWGESRWYMVAHSKKRTLMGPLQPCDV